nr:MAG TPA: hypothetical protein [Caudoviricetes sp.]
MLKKTITYTDYDGMERTEDFWFNLSKTELTKLDAELPGGVLGVLRKIIDKKDRKALVDFIETLILRSYGEKTLDGKRFVKNPDMAEEFMQTPAYDELFMSILSDTDSQTNFINGVIPQSMAKEIEQTDKKQVENALAEQGLHVKL